MKAIKANKQYTINESEKASYLAQGFDIYGDNGKLIERSPSSAVSRREYDELLDKYNKVVSENKKLKDKVKGNVPET
jgi:hypothetical protein